MEKLAQSGNGGGGGGCTPTPPFTVTTITYKVLVYAPAERASTLPLFLLYPYMYSVVEQELTVDFMAKLADATPWDFTYGHWILVRE
jgi:hypothetical protein